MARDESITGAVASRSLPMVALSVVIAFLVVPVSESPYAWIALHSLVAFLAIIATATAIIRNLHSSSLGNWLFSAGLFFIVFRHLAAAIEDFIVVYGAGILEVGEEVLAIPLESVTIGVLFLASEIAYRRPTRLSNRTYAIICAGAVVISFYAYLVLYSWVFFQLDIGTALTITEGVGIIAIGVFLASGLLALHDKQTRTRVEVARHLTIYLLLGVVCIALLLSLLYPSSLWTTAPCLQVIVLFQIIVTVVLPIVSGMQLRLRSAYTFIFIVAVIALLPFVFVLIGEALLPGVRFYSIEVFLLAHIGAAILSGGMAILLYAYSKRQLSQVHFPLIFLFASWTTVEIGLIVTTLVRLPITLNQTLVPYVTGGFASLFLLMWIIRRLRQPREATKPQRLLLKSCLGVAAIVGIIWVGEIMQLSLHSVTTAVVGNPLDRIILMSFNLVLMFLFTFTAFLMLERFRSRITVETLALGFLTLWILPSLIRSITRQWTVGWWVGEFLLLAGLLFGPVILGIAYLDVLGRADDLRRQASLYADLLIHDIGNFHQIIQSSIDLLDIEGVTPEMEKEAMRHARAGLLRAHYLVQNVRQLARIIETQEDMCVPVNLIDSIENAFAQAVLVTQARDVKFHIDGPEGSCYVLATDLLKDLFFNLLRNSIEYSPDEKRILVKIRPAESEDKAWWEIRIIDYGRGIEPELKPRLFERFLEGAQGTGLGLSVVWALAKAFSGSVTVEDRVPGDYRQGSVFIVTLQAAKRKG